MTEIISPTNVEALQNDPALVVANSGIAPGAGWGYQPRLTSSDMVVRRTKDSFAADAQDASRTNPFARSALRTIGDSVIGDRFELELDPDAERLEVEPDEAAAWAALVESIWKAAAKSPFYPMDAQRQQDFVSLMRTAYSVFFSSGEALGTVEWKPSQTATKQATCLHILAPERLSDPNGSIQYGTNRRMGVERDKHGAPVAYHIREQHYSDEGFWQHTGQFKWKRVTRYTYWGRQNVLHFYEHDQADMTRGLSSFTTALQAMRLLQDYLTTELESASIRATYAAVIESKLDYEDAMRVIGEDQASQLSATPLHDFTMRMMAEKAKFYRGQEFRFGKSKVAHLLPDENLKMVQGTQNASAMKDFASVNAYMLASALGVDYTSLTKDFSSTNYSGARAALYDVWRSYEVRRGAFIAGFAWPFFLQWLEEMIVFKGIIPMLGKRSFYEVRDYLARGTFTTWNKPRLDPLKEAQADIAVYNVGGMSLKDIAASEGRDFRDVLAQRAREKKLMESLGLTPEDINPGLLMNAGAQPKGEGTGSEGGASTGSSG